MRFKKAELIKNLHRSPIAGRRIHTNLFPSNCFPFCNATANLMLSCLLLCKQLMVVFY